jgi:alpha-beta hydrolase superfamily lysophospholipase
VNESVVTFGPGLVGIVTDPPADGRRPVGFVLLSAGFTHHVGPQRLHVQLARALSERGFTALRFDYSAIGDSPRRTEGVRFADRALEEARAAFDLLEASRGIAKFAVFGICWGADNAVRVAGADPRVAGVVAVDFYAVMSARYFLRFYARRLANPRSWANLMFGRSAVFGTFGRLLASWSKSRAPAEPAAEPSEELLPVQAPALIKAQLDRLVDRGVALLFCYAKTGGSYDRYVLDFRAHLAELGQRGDVRVAVFADADHVFTPLASQQELIAAVLGWAESH